MWPVTQDEGEKGQLLLKMIMLLGKEIIIPLINYNPLILLIHINSGDMQNLFASVGGKYIPIYI